LFVLMLIYTPGTGLTREHGGWGDLEKLHEISAIFIFGLVWAALAIATAQKRTPLWLVVSASCVAAIAVVTTALTVFVGLFLILMCVVMLIAGRNRSALEFVGLAAWAGVCLLCILLINYAETGIFLDQLIPQTWQFIDLSKVYRLGITFEVYKMHNALTGLVANSVPLTWDVLPILVGDLRLDIWWPILAAGVPLLLARALVREHRTSQPRDLAWIVLATFAATIIVFVLVGGGRSQVISFYRLTTFSYGPMLCVTLLAFAAVMPRQFPKPAEGLRASIVSGFALVAWSLVAILASRAELAQATRANFPMVMSHVLNFAAGEYSIEDAYRNQSGWAGRLPWGAIYPPLMEARDKVGHTTPIWSFHVHTYCVQWDCNVRAAQSYIFSPVWTTVYFGTPQEAREALQREGFSYFFYSHALGVYDPLPKAPLFLPDQIAENLAIAWTDGTNYLLTWPGPDTQPLDEAFVQEYRWNAAELNPHFRWFNADDWRDIAFHTDQKRENLRPFALPWITGSALAHLEPLLHAPGPQPATPREMEPDRPSISIDSATYGGNCGAPIGNTTRRVSSACNGNASCRYIVEHKRLGDPVAQCAKDFTVEYRCQDGRPHEARAPAEAGFGAVVEIECKPTVTSGIDVQSATYGASCGAPSGNATNDLAKSCNGHGDCSYIVDVDRLGDPAPGCGKDFQVEYSCTPDTELVKKELPAEAGLKSELKLNCEPPVASGLRVRSATYGASCGAPLGNATDDLAKSCNGRADCDYVVDVERLRDPAPGCGKNFQVEYSCAPDTARLRKELPGEAGLKKHLQLSCALESQQTSAPAAAPSPPEPTVESGLNIRAATYGASCGAPSGNATEDLASSCNGRADCNYVVDVERLHDPAPGCGKDFQVEYSCAPDTALLRKQLPAEAGLKSQLQLSCTPEAEQVTAPAAPAPVVELGLNIRAATYGASCGAPSGNVTKDIASSCNGRADCNYVVDVERLGDPAPRCGKDFQVEYSCAPGTALLRKQLPAEAGLKSQLQLSCTSESEQASTSAATTPELKVDSGLNIRSATYGANCGAPSGNATRDLANSCNGRADCNYIVDVERLRDPAPRCGKDFQVEYSCAPDTALLRKELPGEAGLKSQLRLSCPLGAAP
jgi:hypothetical protein